MTTATIDDRLLSAIDRIVREVDLDRIVLFGSRARGDMREDSDYDLLMVLPQIRDRWSETVALYTGVAASSIIEGSRVDDTGGGESWRAPGVGGPCRAA